MYARPEGTYAGLTVHRQALELRRKGVEVRVICPTPMFSVSRIKATIQRPLRRSFPEESTIDVEGIPVTYVSYPNPPLTYLPGAHAASLENVVAAVVRRLRPEFQFDLVHGHHLFPVAFVAQRIANQYGVPSVVSAVGSDVHTHPNRNRGIAERTKRVIRDSSAVVAVSQALADQIHQLARPACHAHVVHLGVDTEEFTPKGSSAELRIRLGLPENGVGICTVCWMGVKKGVLDLLDAFERLNPDVPAWLVLVGGGPLEDQLRRRIRSRNLERRVFLAGHQAHSEVPNWLNASDIFVLASYNEGLPNVVLEAMACGRPVLATDVGGVAEAIKDGVSGILIDPGDVDALEGALGSLVGSAALRETMGGAGRQRVLSEFTWARTTAALLEVYSGVLSSCQDLGTP